MNGMKLTEKQKSICLHFWLTAMSKKSRSANFTKNEVRLLINIASKYASVVENKETDAVSWKAKKDIWDEIAMEFNSQSGCTYREPVVIRLKYDCLKRDLKKKVATNRLEVYKTGGGQAQILNLNDYEEKLLQLIKFSVEGLTSRHDSDAGEGVYNILKIYVYVKKIISCYLS